MKEYQVKLNSQNHITLHKVEEKMVPVSLLEKAYQAGMEFEYYKRRPTSRYYPNFKEWLQQNVK